MMENAWLDSLSEDWISQPRSAGSPAGSLPSLPNGSPASVSRSGKGTSSRIPLSTSRTHSASKNSDANNLPLSERSPNNNNIPVSQRVSGRPSKLRKDLSNSIRGRQLSRTASTSTVESVQRHTVHCKSLSTSPQKLRGLQETPEWKRRLLQGDVAYGEQRDLFSSAGLENIFRPPPENIPPSFELGTHSHAEEMTMPSSPPTYPVRYGSDSESPIAPDTERDKQAPIARMPQGIEYKMVDVINAQFSDEDLSGSDSFHPGSPRELPNYEHTEILQGHGTQREKSSHFHERFEGNRVSSGESDIRHEDLSPIFISRHNTVDGRIDYAALDLPKSELQERLKEVTIDDQKNSPQVHDGGFHLESDNETSNEEFTNVGNYVNVNRGGKSEEGSFQQRMLSPSSLPPVDESAMLPDESIQASTPKDTANIRNLLSVPDFETSVINTSAPEIPTSSNSPARQSERENIPGSGSPLKLFGTYDTFTNQKLLRRLSQFENGSPRNSSHNSDSERTKYGESVFGSTGHTEMNEAYIAPSSPSKQINDSKEISQAPKLGDINGFGNGNLDSFEFSEESLDPGRANSGVIPSYLDNSMQGLPHVQQRFSFQLQPSPVLESEIKPRRSNRSHTTRAKERSMTSKSMRRTSVTSDVESALHDPLQSGYLAAPGKRNRESGGKRLLHSPPKNPTPKRRRTLHKSDIAHDIVEGISAELVEESHDQIQTLVGKKRKDARHGDSQEPANPQVMAMRQILRPRTPTPVQRSSQGIRAASATEISGISDQKVRLEQQEKIARVQAELDSTMPFKATAPSVSGQAMHDDSRKGSVTTQDFLDEAKKIMAGIRGKARPSSGLVNVEESESENEKLVSENQEQGQDESYQESTQEPFSRPPSREGGPLSRVPLKQQDPDVLNHLKKYEEMSDLDGIIASSLKSIRLAQDAVGAAKEIDRLMDETISRVSDNPKKQDEIYESDPPNIQITEYPELQRKSKHSTSSVPFGVEDQQEAEFPSHSSNGSSQASTGRSIPTGSSRGSDSKHVIAPHTVSHLIPEQLAGMVFDRENRIWVKRKSINAKLSEDTSPSEDTDDDPFGDIPDLTVDEIQELNRVKTVASKRWEEIRISEVQGHHTYSKKTEERSFEMPIIPMFGLDANIVENADSAEQLEISHLASSIGVQHTARTSRVHESTEEARVFNHAVREETSSLPQRNEPLAEEEAEQEISINESRVKDRQAKGRSRKVTISFSSPLASIIPPGDLDRSLPEHETSLEDSLITTPNTWRRGHISQTRSSQQATSRRVSISGCTFIARPVSRIDEREEESSVEQMDDGHLRRSVSVVITTPLPEKISTDHLSIVPSSGSRQSSQGILQLSPLPDFTLNQSDESFALEVSRIDYQHVQRSATNRRSLSLSVEELVQRITDVEPYEPFWEHIKQIELRGKRLQTLHMLSKFCAQLEELDVSDNDIGQLDGIPRTIRHLRIARNNLSSLSSWGHLTNLQYLDISNNSLTNLEGFQNLVHLRSLRADRNQIQSLKGIKHLDGLISLRLRDNALVSVDFIGSSLHRLAELDLKGNCIQKIHNLQILCSLTTLNLEDNKLYSFEIDNGEILWALKYLKLGGNSLSQLDVKQYPNLRLLYLDRNRLGRIMGLGKVKHLDSLSLREQKEGSSIDPTFLDEAFEVRKLFLSGNLLTTFAPSVDFLNLQYLELANCGLETLPPEFGHLVSNVRILNLNFNALKDIKPLIGIVRLKKLYLAGNRLSRLRKTTNVLAQFINLTKADLRSNPLTLGFYPLLSEKRIVIHQEINDEPETLQVDPFTLQDEDKAKDAAYAKCLDMETKMRRRVYEMLTLSGCSILKMLDGLVLDRACFDIRDNVWEELVRAGVVASGMNTIPENECEPMVSDASVNDTEEAGIVEGHDQKVDSCLDAELEERWPAEDSFA